MTRLSADGRSALGWLRLRLVGRWLLWGATTFVVLVTWAFMVDSAILVEDGIADDEVVTTTVTRLGGEDDDYVTYVEIDGTEYPVEDWYPIFDLGDLLRFMDAGGPGLDGEIDVVLDEEFEVAYPVAAYEPFSWPSALIGLTFLLWLIALLRAFLTRSWMLRDGARWQWWRLDRVHRATVLEIRDPEAGPRVQSLVRRVYAAVSTFVTESDHQPEHLLVLEIDGRVFLWHCKSELDSQDQADINVGDELLVLGRPRLRGWIVALGTPELYPLRPLG